MYKKILISTIAIIISVITWCSKTNKFEFSFDNFNWCFYTNTTFIQNNEDLHWLAMWLLKNNILSIYKEKNISNNQNTGYIDSIIIIKKHTLNTLDEFVTQNIQKIKFEGYSQESDDKNTITCYNKDTNKNIKINIQTISSKLIQNLKTIFFVQSFLIYKDKAYIISYSTDNKNERDTFASNINKLKCQE